MVGLITERKQDNRQTRLLIGFEPNERLTVHIYSPEVEVEVSLEEQTAIIGVSPADATGGYIATRVVETNKDWPSSLNLLQLPVRRSMPAVLASPLMATKIQLAL